MNLNSQFVQWALKFGLSKAGIAVRWIVGLTIGAIAKQKIFPEGDLKEIEVGLTSGAMALSAVVYGYVEWWLQNRQKSGVKVLQEQLNISDAPSKIVEVDGIAGSETVKAAAQVTGVSVAEAVYAVKNPTDPL